jgi:hypothetical protein
MGIENLKYIQPEESETQEGSPPDTSLMRGGPFYRFQQSARLVTTDEWNVGRLITFAICVGWVPLVVMKLLADRENLLPLLKDYDINVRALIVVPVLLLGQLLMETSFRRLVTHIYRAHLLDSKGLAKMGAMIETLVRLRDSVVPEIVILLLVAARLLTADKSPIIDVPWLSYHIGGVVHLKLAGWYAVLISSSIFLFLLGLSLWKWLLWTIFAFRLSRLDLRVLSIHPDGNGGLGFLGITPLAFTPVAFSITAVVAATFRREILREGAHLQDFYLPGAVLVVLIAVLSLGPLVFFVPKLMAVRRQGLLEYATIGQMQAGDFQRKWVYHRGDYASELLAAPEISTLADYGQVFDRVKDMRPFPIDRNAIVALAVAIVIPAMPAVVAEIPFVVVLKQLLGALR